MLEKIKAVRRVCACCIHSSKGFKVYNHTHHHCTHPSRVAGMKDWSAWDTLVDWYDHCDNFEPKPKK